MLSTSPSISPFDRLLLSSLSRRASLVIDSTPSGDGEAYLLQKAADCLLSGISVIYVGCAHSCAHYRSALRKLGTPLESFYEGKDEAPPNTAIFRLIQLNNRHDSSTTEASLSSSSSSVAASIVDDAAATFPSLSRKTSVEGLIDSIESCASEIVAYQIRSADAGSSASTSSSILKSSSSIYVIIEDAGFLYALSSSASTGTLLCRRLILESFSSPTAPSASTGNQLTGQSRGYHSSSSLCVVMRISGSADDVLLGALHPFLPESKELTPPLLPSSPISLGEGYRLFPAKVSSSSSSSSRSGSAESKSTLDATAATATTLLRSNHPASAFSPISLVRYLQTLVDVVVRLAPLATGYSRGVNGRISFLGKGGGCGNRAAQKSPLLSSRDINASSGAAAESASSTTTSPLSSLDATAASEGDTPSWVSHLSSSSLYRLTESKIVGVGDISANPF